MLFRSGLLAWLVAPGDSEKPWEPDRPAPQLSALCLLCGSCQLSTGAEGPGESSELMPGEQEPLVLRKLSGELIAFSMDPDRHT